MKAMGDNDSFLNNFRVFALGLVWTCAGGVTASVVEMWDDWHTYQQIDWEHVWKLAIAGAAPLAIAYYRKHKALLQLPESVRLRLAWAEQEHQELKDNRASTGQLKAVAVEVMRGNEPPAALTEAVLSVPTASPNIITSADGLKEVLTKRDDNKMKGDLNP